MRSEDEMCELFSDIPEALENTVEIAKRCNVTVRLGEYFLPQFPTGDMTTEDYLVKKSKRAWKSVWLFCSLILKSALNADLNTMSDWISNFR